MTSTSMVNMWLENASRYPLLSASQEIQLGNQVRAWLDAESPDAKTIKRGRRAHEKMVHCNMRLVSTVCKKYIPRVDNSLSISHEDLLQEGCLGLTRAVEKFDPTTGYKFSTYAYWWIRQAIGRLCDYNSSSIKITPPVHQMALKWRYRSDGQSLEEFAAERGDTVERVKQKLEHWNRAQVKSLDAKAQSDDEGSESLLNLLASDSPIEDDQGYAQILDDLKYLDGGVLREPLAALELAEECKPAEIADLMGWTRHEVQRKLKDCRSAVREHLPSHIREAIVGPERQIEDVKLVEPQPAPKRELVAVGCQSSSPQRMPESIAAPSTNGHHETTLEQEAATVIAEVQAEAPKRRRRTKAEVQAEKDSKSISVIADGVSLQGDVNDIAKLIGAIQKAA